MHWYCVPKVIIDLPNFKLRRAKHIKTLNIVWNNVLMTNRTLQVHAKHRKNQVVLGNPGVHGKGAIKLAEL